MTPPHAAPPPNEEGTRAVVVELGHGMAPCERIDGEWWIFGYQAEKGEALMLDEIVRLRQQLADANAEIERLREELGDVIEQWADLLPHATVSAELHARMLASAKAAMAKRVIAPNAPPRGEGDER